MEDIVKQIGLTVIALILVVATALPASAAHMSTRSPIASGTTFTLATIPGANGCC